MKGYHAMHQTANTANTPSEVSPSRILHQKITSALLTQAIHAAVQLNLADLVKDGLLSLHELSEATNIPPHPLARLLRALVAADIFTEPEPGKYAQSELSYFLRSDVPNSLRGLAMMFGDEWQWRPWEAFLYSLKTEKPAFDHLYGMSVWQYFRDHNPRSGHFFNEALTSVSNQVNLPIASAYDFSSCETVIDVGGGEGSLLRTILRKYPTIKGILFEQPAVIERARELFVQEGFVERCTLVPGDFFASVPEGADAYLIKHVIRGRCDEEAIAILRNCRRAMKPQSRLFVIEPVLTPQGMLIEKLVDLQLMLISTGSERTEEEYRKLFDAAGFTLTSVIPTTGPISL